MTIEPARPRRIHEPIFDRGWTIPGRLSESRSEMTPDDPDRLLAERQARRGLNPPPVTVRRVS